ncbi:hypothetical protein C0J52_17509 [Blattella germanica]|nr:hypothetical protein C0J52_17509 [Blattella germanica]
MTSLPVRTRSEDPNELKAILQQTHDEALLQNDFATRHWIKVRDEHLSLRSHLVVLPEKLSQEVMVPIGSKALMRGKMVHTNEILVCLGDGWFVKQTAKRAAEICNRRIQLCENMLKDLERERDLLSNRRQIPLEQDAFGAVNRDEILEPYDEQKEAQWREEMVAKSFKVTSISNAMDGSEDDAVWCASDSEESTESVSDMDESDDELRVSFADIKNGDSDGESDSSGETLRIGFHHTPVVAEVPRNNEPNGHPIQTPADIHRFIKDLILKDGVPKSILKNKCTDPVSQQMQLANMPESPGIGDEDDDDEEEEEDDEDAASKDRPTVFGDVLEHKTIPDTTAPIEPSVPTAPTSRFKAARLAARR